MIYRTFLGVLLCLTAAADLSMAQSFPNKPIRLVVGYGPGGVTDLLARAVADGMTKQLGQPVLVENRPGAAGLVGASYVKTSAPDGYTLFAGPSTGFAPIFMQNGFDAGADFSPVSLASAGDWFMYVPSSINVNSIEGLVAYGKANPDKVRSASPATSNSLLVAMVAKAIGVPIEDIKYKTTDQAILALIGGDTHLTFNGASGFVPQIKAGKLKAIATLSPQRAELMPDVKTLSEQGVPITVRFTNGVWAPLGTPQNVIEKLNNAIVAGLKDPEVAQRIRNASLTPTSSTPEELVADLRRQVIFFTEAAKTVGLQPE